MSWVKRKYPGEIFRCRVYPDNKTRYYVVVLFKSKTAMRKAFASLGYTWNHVRRALGMCESFKSISYQKSSEGRMAPLCGLVFLVKGYEGAGIASHEFTHAGIGFMRRNQLDFKDLESSGSGIVPDTEESLCLWVGDMMYQFYSRLRRRLPELWKR